MPELPDIELYLHAMESRIVGRPLTAAVVRSPSLLRTYDPPLEEAVGRKVRRLQRLGKRIVWTLEDDLHLVFHLMTLEEWED